MVTMAAPRRAAGFTLVELLVVMAVIGLLLSIAAPRFVGRVDQARDVVLRHNLAGLRAAIDEFHTDKGRYPKTLQELVDQRYLREVPVDPVTERADTWRMVPPPDATEPAWFDLHSGAPGTAGDGTAYASW